MAAFVLRLGVLGQTPPSNDNFADATLISGTSVVATGSNIGATLEPGERPIEDTPDGVPDASSVWWAWTAPQDGYATVSTAGSVSMDGGQLDTLVGVYSGASLLALTEITSNDDDPNVLTNYTSWVVFQVNAGTQYHISVAGISFDGTNADTGDIVLSLSLSSTPPPPQLPPPNDNFADALELTGTNIVTVGSNLRATVEPNEPVIDTSPDGASVWWVWTAPQDGYAVISTAGSTGRYGGQLDTVLGVYSGTSLGTLTEIASNDDDPSSSTNYTSRVVFQTSAGVPYHIVVGGLLLDGTDADMGNIILSLNFSLTPPPPPPPPPGQTAPPNDNFSDALEITGSDSVATGTNVGATLEPGEPNIAGTPGGSSVWWYWTALRDAYVTITTAGSISADSGDTMDTVLGVYTGNSVFALTNISSDDDDPSHPGLSTSVVQFQATAGTTYYIDVDGFASLGGLPDAGSIHLHLSTSDGPPPLVAAPRWNLPSIAGGMVDSRTFAGNVIVLNFWATWCGPCVEEIPSLIQLGEDYASQGVTVAGISVDDAIGNSAPTSLVGPFASAHSIDYPVLVSRPSWESVEELYGRIAYPGSDYLKLIPTTFIIDRQNRIRTVVTGGHSYAQFESYIKPLLGTNVLSNLELQVSMAGAQIKLSWPLDWSNVSVESKSDLAAASWSAVPYAVQSDSINRFVLVPASAARQYFRLSSQ